MTTHREPLGFYQNSVGATPGPFDSFLVLRGTKTLPVRMDRHCENARALARWLDDHPDVSDVYYPGLDSHHYHDLAELVSVCSSLSSWSPITTTTSPNARWKISAGC
jgi:cystathionine beta-lyase/cystathionine gamma-synthase